MKIFFDIKSQKVLLITMASCSTHVASAPFEEHGKTSPASHLHIVTHFRCHCSVLTDGHTQEAALSPNLWIVVAPSVPLAALSSQPHISPLLILASLKLLLKVAFFGFC